MHFYPLKKVSIWKPSALVGKCPAHKSSGSVHGICHLWLCSLCFLNLIQEQDVHKSPLQSQRSEARKSSTALRNSRPHEACMTQTLCWAWLPEEQDDTFHNKMLCSLTLPPSHLRFLLEGFRFPSCSPKPSCEHTRKGVTLFLQLCKAPGPLLVLNVCTKLTSF